MISLVAKLKARPGKENLLAEECVRLAHAVRENEKDCLAYIPHVSVKDPAEIVFFEQYASQEALDNHRRTPHYRAASEKFKELLASPSEVTILKELK
ncbi:MAG: antibiotic biosynthesis monooxygenase [Peptococcaceae bacterium]|nr:antibiotic biosynthesis monooxygenase [Peptococcaceae bacterium]